MTFIPDGEGNPVRPQFPNMPRVPEFGNVFGTRVELALAFGMPKDPKNTNGGLVPRHQTAVLRYIADMARYALEVRCDPDSLRSMIECAIKYPREPAEEVQDGHSPKT